MARSWHEYWQTNHHSSYAETTITNLATRTSGLTLLATYGPLVWLVAVAGMWAVSLWITPFDSGYTAGEMYDHLLSWRAAC